MSLLFRMRMSTSPMVRATYQAAILSGISNVLAQVFQARRKGIVLHINPWELMRFMIVTLITAPPNYQWQQFLERSFPAYYAPARNDIPLTSHDLDEKNEKQGDLISEEMSEQKPKLNWRNTLTKMFIDSITLGALANTVLFLVLMGMLKGYDYPKLKKTVERDTIPVILSGYKLWPAVSLLSFILIPVERRIVFFGVFGLGWNVYMSLVAAAV